VALPPGVIKGALQQREQCSALIGGDFEVFV